MSRRIFHWLDLIVAFAHLKFWSANRTAACYQTFLPVHCPYGTSTAMLTNPLIWFWLYTCYVERVLRTTSMIESNYILFMSAEQLPQQKKKSFHHCSSLSASSSSCGWWLHVLQVSQNQYSIISTTVQRALHIHSVKMNFFVLSPLFCSRFCTTRSISLYATCRMLDKYNEQFGNRIGIGIIWFRCEAGGWHIQSQSNEITFSAMLWVSHWRAH